jgi:HEAT repeat protein
MAAFAIGEVESLSGANALLTALKSSTETDEVRARAIEGLGKIAAALPKEQQVRSAEISTAITEALKFEMQSQLPNRQFLLLGITAILRSRPANAGQTLTLLLDNNDARIRADAKNALARIRAKDGNNKLANLLVSDPDPVVRSNAARVLGATEEKSAFEKLLASAAQMRCTGQGQRDPCSGNIEGPTSG